MEFKVCLGDSPFSGFGEKVFDWLSCLIITFSLSSSSYAFHRITMLHTILCVIFWSIIGGFILWKLSQGMDQGIHYVKKIHQIPCANCIYFTGDPRLKCTVDPIKALTENAIACGDFASRSYAEKNNQVIRKK